MPKSASVSRSQSRNNSRGRQPQNQAEWQGYVNVYMTEEVRKKAADWYSNWENVHRAMDLAIMDGYRVSFKQDAGSEAYVCMMTTVDASHRDAGWALTERAGDWFKALCRTMYIHHVVLDADWSTAKQQTYLDSDW